MDQQTTQFTPQNIRSDISGRLSLQTLLKDADRTPQMQVTAQGVLLDFSKEQIDAAGVSSLVDVFTEKGGAQAIQSMFAGEELNFTEKRAVLHVALRGSLQDLPPVTINGGVVQEQIAEESLKLQTLVKAVRSGEITGATNKKINTVLCIGIGGSLYGAKTVYEALKVTKAGFESSQGYSMRFLADIDPLDIQEALEGINYETTMAIVLSKSFTTLETMSNAQAVRSRFLAHYKTSHPDVQEADVIASHFSAVGLVTSVTKMENFGILPQNRVFIWDWVGGRYSVSSAIGTLALSMVFGYEVILQFLDGMKNMDQHFRTETDFSKNLPVMLGLIGYYNTHYKLNQSRAVIPYNIGLRTFVQHSQQLTMESIGKQSTKAGDSIPDSDRGVIIIGESGTKGQHSFFQSLHQGTVVPVEFIGFCKTPFDEGTQQQGVASHHEKLLSNLFAQVRITAI